MNTKAMWNKIRPSIEYRFDTEYPPFRNVAVIVEGDDLIDIIEVESEFEDGILQVIIGSESVTCTLTWTYRGSYRDYQTRDSSDSSEE